METSAAEDSLVTPHALVKAQTVIQKSTKDLLIDMVAGMTGGLITTVLFYPLEAIEIRQQIGQFSNKGRALGTKDRSVRYPLWQATKDLVQREGVRALYKGLTPTAVAATVNWGCYLPIYEFTKAWWAGSEPPTTAAYMAGGFVSGFLTTFVVNPIIVIRVRMATAPQGSQAYQTMGKTATHIVQNEGVKSLWKGVGPSLLGVSEGMIQFSVYEQLKPMLRGIPGDFAWCGLLSKVVATSIAYPYLVLRSSLQSDSCPYSSFSDCISKIYAHEGMRGFYKGIIPNLTRQLLPAGLVFYIVETMREQLSAW